MTPKEKAIELFDTYYEFDFNTVWVNKQRKLAKQCALIAVDEILTSKQTAYPNQVIELGQVFVSYWQEVKTEIENL